MPIPLLVETLSSGVVESIVTTTWRGTLEGSVVVEYSTGTSTSNSWRGGSFGGWEYYCCHYYFCDYGGCYRIAVVVSC